MPLAIGVDVGGTKLATGVVADDGAIVEKQRLPSPSDDPAELRQTIHEIVAELRSRHQVGAVGVSAAGFVAADRRSVLFAPNLQFGDSSLADQLEESIGLPVVVENDGNSAAWAESRFGAGIGFSDQLAVVLGTGIGGGLILGGRVYRGGHGVAAEIGHLGLVRDGIPCNCGRRGCFEQYASGNALQREARLAAAEGRAPALLASAGGDPERVHGKMVSRLAQSGDADALALFDRFAEALGAGIATLVAVLDPALVLLGGGVSEAGDLLLDRTVAALHKDITGGERHPFPEVRLAALGNDAGLIGAADLARQRD